MWYIVVYWGYNIVFIMFQFINYVESNLDETLSWNDWQLMGNISSQVLKDFTSIKKYTQAVEYVSFYIYVYLFIYKGLSHI